MSERPIRQHRFRPPPGATEILLVRHGESAAAVPGRPFARSLVDGHGDPALAPEGELQAMAVGERLAGAAVDGIVVTTLQRTAQTAAPLVARAGLEPVVVADLREVHLGEWEGGLFRQKVAAGDPIVVTLFTEERWDAIPGAEPAEAFAARVRSGIEQVAAAHPGGRVAVFTHGGVIGEVLRQATGSRPFAFAGADNGSISQVVVHGARWTLRGFNDVSHLVGLVEGEPVVDDVRAAGPAGPGGNPGFSV